MWTGCVGFRKHYRWVSLYDRCACFLFFFFYFVFNTAWKQPSRVLLTSAPLHNQVMGHSAGIMSSLWVWSSPCFLSSIHQSPSPSSVMLPGSLLTSAATRIHHHPWRLCKRWVWLHVYVRACVCVPALMCHTDGCVSLHLTLSQQAESRWAFTAHFQ